MEKLQLNMEQARHLDALLKEEKAVKSMAYLQLLVRRQIARQEYGRRCGAMLAAARFCHAQGKHRAAAVCDAAYSRLRRAYYLEGYGRDIGGV